MHPKRSSARRLENLVQSLFLLVGMILTLALLGWVIGGFEGMTWTLLAGLMVFSVSPRISPRLVLKMYGAQRLSPEEVPGLHALLGRLAKSAGLPQVPHLYRIPSPMMNAFAAGCKAEAVLAVTDGLLRRLNARELAGVLAHEMTHVQHNDIGVMGIADVVSRLTSLLSLVGQALVLIDLPLILFSDRAMPWLALLVLLSAPTLSALLQLALSRSREFDADLGSARLTGDPTGLACALEKLDHCSSGRWGRIFPPGRRMPHASLLCTHPATQERIRRLRTLAEEERGSASLREADANALTKEAAYTCASRA